MIFIWICIVVIVCIVFKLLSSTDVPKINGLPEASGWPIFGSLFELGRDHSVSFLKIAKKLGPVFQIRLGSKRIIVANSYDSIKELWIKNQSSLISRPVLYTFHKVISSSQGLTIGTSPWDESCKRRRKTVATALNSSAIQSYMPIVDLESYSAISEILEESKDGRVDTNIIPHIKRFSLNISLTLNYGMRFSSPSNELLKEIVAVERNISRFRSTSNNWQDYIPLLRFFSVKSSEANSYRLRRDKYLEILLNCLRENIANGTDKPCITGNVLRDSTAKLNEAELKSICVTMSSGGVNTLSSNIILGIGYLSSPHGQEIQERAYAEIQSVYSEGDAWEKCLMEERIPYITALCKEILRYYTVARIAPPRQSIKDIEYNGVTIPAGTTFLMNAFAGNYDADHFKDPYAFNPERYFDDVTGMPHYGYGAGSRMCIGSHLANRELFIFFVRLISAFRILEPEKKEHAAKTDALETNDCPGALTVEPKMFKCRFEPRNKEDLNYWLESSRRKTETQ